MIMEGKEKHHGIPSCFSLNINTVFLFYSLSVGRFFFVGRGVPGGCITIPIIYVESAPHVYQILRIFQTSQLTDVFIILLITKLGTKMEALAIHEIAFSASNY